MIRKQHQAAWAKAAATTLSGTYSLTNAEFVCGLASMR